MRVLVTGAFGRLGQEGLERLLEEGHSPIAFDVPNRRNRREAKRFARRVHVVWGDIREPSDKKKKIITFASTTMKDISDKLMKKGDDEREGRMYGEGRKGGRS